GRDWRARTAVTSSASRSCSPAVTREDRTRAARTRPSRRAVSADFERDPVVCENSAEAGTRRSAYSTQSQRHATDGDVVRSLAAAVRSYLAKLQSNFSPRMPGYHRKPRSTSDQRARRFNNLQNLTKSAKPPPRFKSGRRLHHPTPLDGAPSD